MKVGKIIEGFSFLPSISLQWYIYEGKRHYHLQFAWLWWYITTLKYIKWDED